MTRANDRIDGRILGDPTKHLARSLAGSHEDRRLTGPARLRLKPGPVPRFPLGRVDYFPHGSTAAASQIQGDTAAPLCKCSRAQLDCKAERLRLGCPEARSAGGTQRRRLACIPSPQAATMPTDAAVALASCPIPLT